MQEFRDGKHRISTSRITCECIMHLDTSISTTSTIMWMTTCSQQPSGMGEPLPTHSRTCCDPAVGGRAQELTPGPSAAPPPRSAAAYLPQIRFPRRVCCSAVNARLAGRPFVRQIQQCSNPGAFNPSSSSHPLRSTFPLRGRTVGGRMSPHARSAGAALNCRSNACPLRHRPRTAGLRSMR